MSCTKPPILNRRTSNVVKYSSRICPYSTCDQTGRIPTIEKSVHLTTSGQMSLDIRGGQSMAGWRCDDPNCSYFTGIATTPIVIKSRRLVIDPQTFEYNVVIESYEVPIGCSGIKFWEC